MTQEDRTLIEACVARNRQFADMLVLAIGLAAHTHPEELRAAFGGLFDLSAIEEMCTRIMRVATDAQQKAIQARELNQQVLKQLDEIENQIDRLNCPPLPAQSGKEVRMADGTQKYGNTSSPQRASRPSA